MMSKNVCVSVRELLRLPVWFVFEDGEEDAVHRGSVEEDADGSDSPANLAEAAVDDVGGAHPLALGEGICRASRACPGASVLSRKIGVTVRDCAKLSRCCGSVC